MNMLITGLHKQILYKIKGDDKPGEPGIIITILILLFSAILLALLKLPCAKPLMQKTPFFLSLDAYFYFILSVFFINLVFAIIPKTRKYTHPFNFILILADGYCISEIVYRCSPIKVPPGWLLFLGDKGINHLNNFFLHRMMQLFPLVMILGLYYIYADSIQNYLHFGNLSISTNILNKKIPQSWKAILVKFCLWLIGILVIIFFLKKSQGSIKFPTIMLIPILLYALWNCFVEETVFRGILLPVFCKSYDQKWGNIIQAVLFGFLHFNPLDIKASLLKVLIFSFLGWFFGRATMETRGIGTSFIMHAIIVAGIEVRLLWG